jgi:thioredoxin-like negative regulator of GroEL
MINFKHLGGLVVRNHKIIIGVLLIVVIVVTVVLSLYFIKRSEGFENDGSSKALSNALVDATSLTPSKGECAVVLFYAPWCVHCVHFKPIYEKIATTCLEKQIGVRFAALDGSKFPKVIQDYKLKAYPTIGVIRNNEFTMFTGQRSEHDIISWIQTL